MAETKIIIKLFLSFFVCTFGAMSSDAADPDSLSIRWSRDRMDGTRTGVTTPAADNVEEALGRVEGKTYYAPNGKIFKGGSVAKVASVVLDAQPTMAQVKTVIGHSPQAMVRQTPECALSDWFIDVIMAAVQEKSGKKVHAGIGNFGGIRIDMPQGDILLDDMLSMFPFKNTIVYVALKGADLKAILEQMAATRIQVLGGVRIKVKDGELLSATIDGRPIEDDQVYGVATISFLLNGGDGLYVARNAVEMKDFADIDIIDVILEFIEKETAAGRDIAYQMDGRVEVL